MHWQGWWMWQHDHKTKEGKEAQKKIKSTDNWRTARNICLKKLDTLIWEEQIPVPIPKTPIWKQYLAGTICSKQSSISSTSTQFVSASITSTGGSKGQGSGSSSSTDYPPGLAPKAAPQLLPKPKAAAPPLPSTEDIADTDAVAAPPLPQPKVPGMTRRFSYTINVCLLYTSDAADE